MDETTQSVLSNLYDWALNTMEAASYFPVIGDPASLALALMYAANGDYENASLNLAAAAIGVFTAGEGKLVVKGGVLAVEGGDKWFSHTVTDANGDTIVYAEKNGAESSGSSSKVTLEENHGQVDIQLKPKVTAELEVNGQKFTDTNQTARPAEQANKDEPTLIANRVDKKIDKTGKLHPNGNMADAHAEIGAIQQAYKAGLTKDADLVIKVAGEDVCGFCKGDIAAAAKEAGAKSVTVHAVDKYTGLPKTYIWEPGMKTLKVIEK